MAVPRRRPQAPRGARPVRARAPLTRRRRSWCSRRPSPGCPSSAGRHRSCRSRRTRTGRWSEGDTGVSAGPGEEGRGSAGTGAAAGAGGGRGEPDRAGGSQGGPRRGNGAGRPVRAGKRPEAEGGPSRAVEGAGRRACAGRGKARAGAGRPGPGGERSRSRSRSHLDERAEQAGAEVPQVLGDGLQRHPRAAAAAARASAAQAQSGAGPGRADRRRGKRERLYGLRPPLRRFRGRRRAAEEPPRAAGGGQQRPGGPRGSRHGQSRPSAPAGASRQSGPGPLGGPQPLSPGPGPGPGPPSERLISVALDGGTAPMARYKEQNQASRPGTWINILVNKYISEHISISTHLCFYRT